MCHAYLFEAKSIQAYIFATNRLKEMVGASELIESITAPTGLLMTTIEQLALTIQFSRCGGGAFYAFGNKNDIETLKSLWPLLIAQYAPALGFIHASAHADNNKHAFELAYRQLVINRNHPKVRLPSASVFAQRCRRTGDPASHYIYKGEVAENVDTAIYRKLAFRKSHALARRFDPMSDTDNWPLTLTPEGNKNDFPFQSDNINIGLIHADGNGLGQLLLNIKNATNTLSSQAFIDVFHDFSKAITQATESAAQQTVAAILADEKVAQLYPARPIVLGGDDLTIIVRADLALPFAHAFLRYFESSSAIALKPLLSKYKLKTALPKRLTACAGIVYAKANQPFYLMHQLAESLCKHAKNKAKAHQYAETPSALSFHRITTALVDDYSTILSREITQGNLRQTLECYALDKGKNMPVLEDLLALQRLLEHEDISKSATRQLLSLAAEAPEQASQRYTRWREVMNEKQPEILAEYEQQVDQLVQSINPKGVRFNAHIFDQATQALTETLIRTPFSDVITLIAMANKDIQQEELR